VRRFVAVLGVPWNEHHGNTAQAVAICRRCARRGHHTVGEALAWIQRADPRLVLRDAELPLVQWGVPNWNDLLLVVANVWASRIFPRRLSREEQRVAELREREWAEVRMRSDQDRFRALGRPFELVEPDGAQRPPRRWPRKHWRPNPWIFDDPPPGAA
jgi:hypothetical protein